MCCHKSFRIEFEINHLLSIDSIVPYILRKQIHHPSSIKCLFKHALTSVGNEGLFLFYTSFEFRCKNDAPNVRALFGCNVTVEN